MHFSISKPLGLCLQPGTQGSGSSWVFAVRYSVKSSLCRDGTGRDGLRVPLLRSRGRAGDPWDHGIFGQTETHSVLERPQLQLKASRSKPGPGKQRKMGVQS